MAPNSILLLVVLIVLAVAGVAGVILLPRLFVKIGCGLLALLFAMTSGIAVVNDYYGYYQSWAQLSADLTGSYSSFANTTAPSRTGGPVLHGQLRSMVFRGRRSDISRAGFVYLPPQYFEHAYARTRFPVIELIHGAPGNPSSWVVHLHLASVMEHLLANRAIGPMIVVMPAMYVGRQYEECLDEPGGPQDDTYISYDVRADVLAGYRASRDPAQWGIGGLSSGGYCAVNLALRHRGQFGAAAAMDGYFRPTDGPAAALLHDNPALEAVNNPLLMASRLRGGTHPLAAFWLSAGTGDARDWASARAFGQALHGIEQVTLYREPGASHNVYAWSAALPHLLAWAWTQLAPPSLRVQFPIAGPVRSGIIAPAQQVVRHHRDRRLLAKSKLSTPAPRIGSGPTTHRAAHP